MICLLEKHGGDAKKETIVVAIEISLLRFQYSVYVIRLARICFDFENFIFFLPLLKSKHESSFKR